MDQLRKELAEIRRSSPSDETLRDAKLKTWTKRTYEKLKGLGFVAEAEQGFGRTSITHLYEGVDKRAKMRDDALLALRDDVASHPEHYLSTLGSADQSEFVSAKLMSAKPSKVFLGHGKNKLWARVHMYLKDELHLDVETWEAEPRAGLHS